MKDQKFGIEIELTGITRKKAIQCIAEVYETQPMIGNYLKVTDSKYRIWKAVTDGSIQSMGGEQVEIVSPILTYDDIEALQKIIRGIRKAGGKVNSSCGIHIHINAEPHNAKTLKNLVNIIASKEDLLYKSLKVNVRREDYCKKMDIRFLDEINRKRLNPSDKEKVKNIWYRGRDGSHRKYHSSRYHGLNLHSVFEKGTIEFRLFNSTLHAGEVKAYIQLCLAISHQALIQKRASRQKTITTNDKYTFRTWLLRLGFIGDEFKTARLHLLKNLDGLIAWKTPEQQIEQKQRLKEQSMMEQTMQ